MSLGHAFLETLPWGGSELEVAHPIVLEVVEDLEGGVLDRIEGTAEFVDVVDSRHTRHTPTTRRYSTSALGSHLAKAALAGR